MSGGAGQGRGCIAKQFRNKLNNFSISQTDIRYMYIFNVLVVVTAVVVVVIEFQIEFN